jgi:hypothetical protein
MCALPDWHRMEATRSLERRQEDGMVWILGISLVAITIGVLATWRQAAGQGWRWGWRLDGTASVGEGAYRGATVALRRPRRLPVVCAVTAVVGIAWGTLTLLFLAPAGVLFCTIGVGLVAEGVLAGVGVVLFIGVTLHGFLIGPRLMALVSDLVVRRPEAAERIERTAKATLGHHAAAAASTLFLSVGADLWHLLGWTGIACAIGLAHGGLLLRARRVLAAIDRDDRAAAAVPSV